MFTLFNLQGTLRSVDRFLLTEVSPLIITQQFSIVKNFF